MKQQEASQEMQAFFDPRAAGDEEHMRQRGLI